MLKVVSSVPSVFVAAFVLLFATRFAMTGEVVMQLVAVMVVMRTLVASLPMGLHQLVRLALLLLDYDLMKPTN